MAAALIPATRVVHCRDPHDVYIARANATRRVRRSIWGNPFRIGPDGSREDVVSLFLTWLLEPGQARLRSQLPTLRGKTLGCWCEPELCHGHVLAALCEEQRND